MKHYILVHNPKIGTTVTREFETFEQAQLYQWGAEACRSVAGVFGKPRLVVEHFVAESIEQVKKTHSRYFDAEVER